MAASDIVSPQVWKVSTKLCEPCIDGQYDKCRCDEEQPTKQDIYQLYKELSSDSLDQCYDTPKRKHLHSACSDYAFDNEFEDEYVNVENARYLPPSTTDWDSIDSVLENELNLVEVPEQDIEKTPLSQRLSRSFHMQMVFVDSDESDKDSIPDVEVYYDDDIEYLKRCGSQGNDSVGSERNIDSRDSGYVTDLSIERVTDTQTRRRSLEPVEASTRILASLKLHEEHEIQKKKRTCGTKKERGRLYD